MTALVILSPRCASARSLQFLQDHGRDLRGRIGFLTELDPDDATLFRQVVGK